MTFRQKIGWIGLIWLLSGYSITLILLGKTENEG
jgi:hypothetical protein